MGQYYLPIIATTTGLSKAYSRHIIINGKREYVMAKLTEHSWWGNRFVEAVSNDIYQLARPVKVAWVGDYVDQIEDAYDTPNGNRLSSQLINDLWKWTWDTPDNKLYDVEPTDFTLEHKYLINHTKRVYVNCDEYYQNSVFDGDWCIHPLPLLTVVGNGLGGGDYSYPTEDSTPELVGTWAWDEISIEDAPPTGYQEIVPMFKEKR